jgi:hypothetical protein
MCVMVIDKLIQGIKFLWNVNLQQSKKNYFRLTHMPIDRQAMDDDEMKI